MGPLLALFRKDEPAAASPPPPFKRDPRKARGWFTHGQTAADSRNYDYAIECLVHGLKFDPDNLEKHMVLRDVALRRHVAGGKRPGIFASLKPAQGKTPLDKMLSAEESWAKDPLNPQHALAMMEYAAEAQQTIGELNLGPVVDWVGSALLEAGQTAKKLGKAQYLKARDALWTTKAWDRAIDACRLALQLDPENPQLLQDLKNLEAERTMSQAYEKTATGGEGSFQDAVKDLDQQRLRDAEDQRSSRSESALEQLLAARRAEYEENPSDHARLSRLVDVLVQKSTDEAENEAIKVLRTALEETGQYRYKVRIGDITMRQMNRHLRQLKSRIDADANDAAAREAFQELNRRKLAFELEEFAERERNYPTDMGVKYELGRRLYLARRFDEAIAAFQEAQADAKFRIRSLEFLGMCYLAKGWFDEALATLRKARTDYPITDDLLALELRYLLMDALEQSARKNHSLQQGREAEQVASEIITTNINFRDIRERRERLRTLVEGLQTPA